MKILLFIHILLVSLFGDIDFSNDYTLNDFNNFKVYSPKGSYFNENLKLKKGNLSSQNIDKLNTLFTQEKIVRDLLLMLSSKYEYNFMPYIAMLTHKQLLILEAFYAKYDLAPPEDINSVGLFTNKKIQKRYEDLFKNSLKSEKMAADLSVTFMKQLVNLYAKTAHNLPKGFKRQLLQSNAFNKKVLRMFKKGLRNIELGLPIE
jgi:hypothetical protein